MSVAICRSSTAAPSFPLEKEGFGSILMMPAKRTTDSLLPPAALFPSVVVAGGEEEQQSAINKDKEPPGQFDIWSSIQSHKAAAASAAPTAAAPYVHPLGRRSSRLLSQKSLETCTESLGSETGSDDFSASDDDVNYLSLFSAASEKNITEKKTTATMHDGDIGEVGFRGRVAAGGRKEAAAVNYHCSVGRRSPPRSFPPPLPSISRRDGPCVAMRPHRKDGRLVVEAVTVPSQNYLHAERQGGRLLLSFIDSAPKNTSEIPDITDETKTQTQTRSQSLEEMINTKPEASEELEDIVMEEQEQEELDEEEEEVEVVDRGTVVEVKVSTQPQPQSGGATAMKVHRSSLVINKFVGGTPLIDHNDERGLARDDTNDIHNTAAVLPLRRQSQTTTTAAAAAVAASSLSTVSSDEDHRPSDSKLLFSSKRRNREELLHDMRRCSQLRKPLFIWEPCCIATSS